MSKQSNQRYRKEMEQQGKSTTNSIKTTSSNNVLTKNQPSQNDDSDGAFNPTSSQRNCKE